VSAISFHDHEGVVANVRDAALEVKNAGHRTHIDDRRGVTKAGQMGSQLTRALFICAVGEADEKVFFRLANVAPVDRAGRLDGEQRREKLEDRGRAIASTSPSRAAAPGRARIAPRAAARIAVSSNKVESGTAKIGSQRW